MNFPFTGISPSINRRFFASASEGKGSIPQGADIVADSGANGATIGDSGVNGDEGINKFKEMLQSAAKCSSEKVKEAPNEVSPHVQQLLDAYPNLRDVMYNCLMVAPNTIASQYATKACREAFVLSVIWFLYLWKTNLVARVIEGANRDELLALDRIVQISSVGLLVVGTVALVESFGVPVRAVLTMGGIVGVATAFAAKDIIGNVLSGLFIQISQPFSIGDTIK
ncbi:hypothetical protein OROGR_005398 [Orobanche gracilis]